jgi:hypothetical protein
MLAAMGKNANALPLDGEIKKMRLLRLILRSYIKGIMSRC